MEQLQQLRTNIFYKKNENGEMKKHFEFIFICDTAEYTSKSEGEIIRDRKLVEHRLTTNDDGVDYLIEALTKYKQVDENELK